MVVSDPGPDRCPYCKQPFVSNSTRILCPECKTSHDSDCWSDNGGCAVFGCAGKSAAVSDGEYRLWCQTCGKYVSDPFLSLTEAIAAAKIHTTPKCIIEIRTVKESG